MRPQSDEESLPSASSPPTLEYAPKPERRGTQMSYVVRILAGLLIVAFVWATWAMFAPERAIWYFGDHSQWVLEITRGHIYFGRSSSTPPELVGPELVVFVYLVTFAIPVWIVDRIIAKRLKRVKSSVNSGDAAAAR